MCGRSDYSGYRYFVALRHWGVEGGRAFGPCLGWRPCRRGVRREMKLRVRIEIRNGWQAPEGLVGSERRRERRRVVTRPVKLLDPVRRGRRHGRRAYPAIDTWVLLPFIIAPKRLAPSRLSVPRRRHSARSRRPRNVVGYPTGPRRWGDRNVWDYAPSPSDGSNYAPSSRTRTRTRGFPRGETSAADTASRYGDWRGYGTGLFPGDKPSRWAVRFTTRGRVPGLSSTIYGTHVRLHPFPV